MPLLLSHFLPIPPLLAEIFSVLHSSFSYMQVWEFVLIVLFVHVFSLSSNFKNVYSILSKQHSAMQLNSFEALEVVHPYVCGAKIIDRSKQYQFNCVLWLFYLFGFKHDYWQNRWFVLRYECHRSLLYLLDGIFVLISLSIINV